MSDSYQKDSVTYIRRNDARQPSVLGHALRALAFLVIAVAALGFGYQFLGNENDAIAVGEIDIEKPTLQAASDNLEGDGTDLPDFLQGEVPEGVNPTEGLDALGNPIGGNAENSETAGGLVGGNTEPAPVETIASVQLLPSGPKTILIDGRPIAGGSFPTVALPRAPLADITRNNPYGPMPTISPSGKKASTSYARPFAPTAGKRQVALVIGGLGIDRNLTRRIINELPPEVTLSFAAHTNGLQTWVHQARDRGHEVIIELPMEGYSFNPAEPGARYALKAEASAATNIRNLDHLLSRAQGYFAVTNYNGDRLIDSPSAMTPVLQHLSNAGVGFLYDGSSSAENLSSLAVTSGVTYQRAFTVIDEQSDIAMINSQLSTLESASSGSAQIGVGFALPETFIAVKSWTGSLNTKGMELAPASYVLNQ